MLQSTSASSTCQSIESQSNHQHNKILSRSDHNHKKKIVPRTMEYVYAPEEAFVTTIATFTLFGLWPSAVKHPILSIAYRIYGFIYQLLYIISLLPTQLINIYIMRGNLQKLVESSFFTLTCAGYATKLFLKKEHLAVLKSSNNTAELNSMVYLALCLFTCMWWIMYPFVDSKQEKVLLFAAWYPFDTSKKSIYGYTYAFQTLLLLTTASMASMMDMLVTNFYVLMVGQIEILKQDFRSIADTVVIGKLSNAKFSDGTETNNEKLTSGQEGRTHLVSQTKLQRLKHLSAINPSKFSFSEAEYFEKSLQERIIHCAEHYEAIYTFVNDVTQLFQIGIVAQICASSIVICVTCFELTSLSPCTLQFYVMLQYQICMLTQIFIYTWRGNDIIVKTSELQNAIYDCAWPSIPEKEFRKSLCIIMTRLQKSVQLRVGNFFLLSVDTFFNILRSAYSFYILLKQIHATDT
ncbi:odorant receptor Or1-like [Belonocnema kinseyi]|uniref:odorant receptor Or1-like n=1 Tax=Belonocnema kinseyi TaxID=2817044 RepID=UPI00143DF791|nr:odorant receptor Or1-like [Belonocnema kinseyi]